MFTLVKDNDNNRRNLKDIMMKLSVVNNRFIRFINESGIDCVNLTSVGNSIATGYSMNDMIKPLLLRNGDLIRKCNFNLNLRSYARAQDNNDEHIFDWFINNIKQSEINKKVQYDFMNDNGLDHKNIDDEKVMKYYPTEIKNDIGLRDLVSLKGDNLANIIVYNGVTGSFLDNLTRHGRMFRGFGRDLVSLESSLKYIYLTNPYTQVYVCGIPNLLGINAVEVVNKEIRKICKMYNNCCYVKPVAQNLLYIKDGKKVLDVHYNREEYLNLNKSILEAIMHNYFPIKALTDFDIEMKKYSAGAEYGNKPDVRGIIDSVFSKYDLNNDQLKRVAAYFKERYPFDFYYTPRQEVIDEIKSRSK